MTAADLPEAPAEAIVAADDMIEDPQADPEMQLLGALLWADSQTVLKARQLLEADVFYRPIYGEVYSIITALAMEGRDHRSPSVLAAMTIQGRLAGEWGRTFTRILMMATTAGSDPLHVPQLCYLVGAAAYRRTYHAVAQQVILATGELGEADLFNRLVELGKQQRERENTMCQLRNWSAMAH